MRHSRRRDQRGTDDLDGVREPSSLDDLEAKRSLLARKLDALGLEPHGPIGPPSTFQREPIAKPSDMAPHIEHTILRPDATPAELRQLCEEAVRFSLAAVCVNPCYVGNARQALHGTTCSV